MSLSESRPAAPVPEPVTLALAEGRQAGRARGFARGQLLAHSLERMPPALAGLLIQVVATAAALALYCVAEVASIDTPWTLWALLQAGIAVLLATATGQAQWWIVMHSAFAPAALLLGRIDPPPWIYLGFAGALAVTNGNALRERVPLFLTSRAACDRLLELLPTGTPIRFVDLGCGLGGVVCSVGRERPTDECLGLETAWLPYAVSRLRSLASPNRVTVRRQDLWTQDLSGADVVYAYLSPVPMARLWAKATGEMQAGSLFISNSFPVPGVAPERTLPVDDATGSALHVYRMGGPAAAAAITESSAARS